MRGEGAGGNPTRRKGARPKLILVIRAISLPPVALTLLCGLAGRRGFGGPGPHRRSPLSLLPRHSHPLQPRLRIVPSRPLVQNGYPKPIPPIAMRARIRRHAVAPLEIAAPVFRVAPARTTHHDHLMRRQVTQPQPPIALSLLQLHEKKIRTPSFRDTYRKTRAPRIACASCVWPSPGAGKAQSRARLTSPRNILRSASLDGAPDARATLRRPAHERASLTSPFPVFCFTFKTLARHEPQRVGF